MKNSNDNNKDSCISIIVLITIVVLGFIVDSCISLIMYQYWIMPLSDNLPELTFVNIMEIKLFINFLFSKSGNLKFNSNDND